MYLFFFLYTENTVGYKSEEKKRCDFTQDFDEKNPLRVIQHNTHYMFTSFTLIKIVRG